VSTISVPKSRDADDVARFLAGLKSRPGSPFAPLEELPAWKQHAAEFDAAFARYDKERLPAMRNFQKTVLSGPAFDKANLFYPFGGPDFLNAIQFFPDREYYFFVGLEPPGTVPAFKQFAGQDMGAQLPRMRRTLRSLLALTYFQTLEMEKQVKGQITDGLLPLMLVQIERTGNSVLGWTPIVIADDGTAVLPPPKPEPAEGDEQPTAAASPEKPKASAVRNPWKVTHGVMLEFQKEGSTQVQRLIYVSTNVEDFIIDQNKPFTHFLERMQPNDAMFKAASYLCHRDRQPNRKTPTFATIREKTLEYAQAIVEDDSGIPYRLFDPNVWDITLFGQYVMPIGIFKARLQQDLVAAYKGPDVKKLDFAIGYSVGKMPSNLMVAVKKKLPPIAVPPTTAATTQQGN
jgi:hypothetical protein